MTIETEIDNGINIESEMRQSYMDYAMSVIIGRALPDVRDGLKPVQRRVLYAMMTEGLISTRKTSKCAGVVGEVLKRLHPHGDSSVYDALVRLAQPWNLRYPLVDGQGNFGSIDGDPAAAYRYTECRMTSAAEKLLEDIDKKTVNFIPNFDDSSQEPVVLPSVIPNLIINGADGIAVGMATHIPPHNLGEVINAAVALIGNEDITLPELMEHIPGPDFPTGGVITGKKPILQAYGKGRGILKICARSHTEMLKRKNREVEAIIVSEVPYQVNKARLIEKIANLVNEKNIEGISHIRDESDRAGMRIVLELKRDATAEVVLNQLYKMTPMRTSFGVINLAIVEGKPVICTLKQMLGHFIDHRRDVVTRRTQYLLGKAKDRMHILDGFRIALLNLDEVIKIIRGVQTPKEAKSGLMTRFELSEIQAQAILDLRLQKLTGMECLAVEKEWEELRLEIERLEAILADTSEIDKIIVTELEGIKEKYNDARRTSIEDGELSDLDMLDLIEDEEMVITVSHKGYVKRTSVSEFRAQRRGGKGVSGAASQDNDFVEHMYVASTHSNLLVFTSKGRLYWLRAYQIPESGRTARGRALVNLINVDADESITAIRPVREFKEGRFIVMATEQGFVKKTDLMEFSRPRKGGVIACTLNEGDRMIEAQITSGNDDIIFASNKGMAIRFSEKDVRTMGRGARGVRGIRIAADERLVGVSIVSREADEDVSSETITEDGMLLTVCEHGHGKRTRLEDYRQQGRGGKGVIDIQTDGRNGDVVNVWAVNDDCGLMIITSSGKIIRTNARDISIVGRNTKGVRLINLEEGEKVVAVARFFDESDNEPGDDSEEVVEVPAE